MEDIKSEEFDNYELKIFEHEMSKIEVKHFVSKKNIYNETTIREFGLIDLKDLSILFIQNIIDGLHDDLISNEHFKVPKVLIQRKQNKFKKLGWKIKTTIIDEELSNFKIIYNHKRYVPVGILCMGINNFNDNFIYKQNTYQLDYSHFDIVLNGIELPIALAGKFVFENSTNENSIHISKTGLENHIMEIEDGK